VTTLKAGATIVCGLKQSWASLVADRMPEFTPWPGGLIRRSTGAERRELWYHNFHDTPVLTCKACAWESSI
jgi:hypothetical protein